MKPKKLNVGCGNRILEGFVNLDINSKLGVDIVHDLRKFPYPFKDNEFDFILIDNVLEHLDNTMGIMEEIYRITKYGGKVKIIVPYFSHPSAWSEPNHKKAFSEDAFKYFSKDDVSKLLKRNPELPLSVKSEFLFEKFKYKYCLTYIGKLIKPFVRILKPFCNALIVSLEVEYEK